MTKSFKRLGWTLAALAVMAFSGLARAARSTGYLRYNQHSEAGRDVTAQSPSSEISAVKRAAGAARARPRGAFHCYIGRNITPFQNTNSDLATNPAHEHSQLKACLA